MQGENLGAIDLLRQRRDAPLPNGHLPDETPSAVTGPAVGVALLDAAGRLLLLNVRAEALLGVSAAELSAARRPLRLVEFIDRGGARLRLRELPPVIALRRGEA